MLNLDLIKCLLMYGVKMALCGSMVFIETLPFNVSLYTLSHFNVEENDFSFSLFVILFFLSNQIVLFCRLSLNGILLK